MHISQKHFSLFKIGTLTFLKCRDHTWQIPTAFVWQRLQKKKLQFRSLSQISDTKSYLVAQKINCNRSEDKFVSHFE